uniref:Uncharacterized protein n=1 Tax=Cairina moschata TaxID=8855 RepID=A0A8C3CAG5_CAIMO
FSPSPRGSPRAYSVLTSDYSFFSQLKEYQQKNSPGATAGAKKKRKTKEGSRPETPTNDDRQSPENVSEKGMWGSVFLVCISAVLCVTALFTLMPCF